MNKFKRVYIEISNICNLQCSFCPVVERDKKIMPADMFKSIINNVAPHTEQVCLHLMGEPLAHPEFETIIKYCEEAGVRINLTTNGILLNRYKQLLSTSPAFHQINFSIHAFKDNFKNKDINPYLQDILNFSKESQEIRPELYINYRLWNIFETTTQNDSNSDILKTIGNFFETEIKEDIDVGNIKSKRIYKRVYLHFDSRFEWPSPLMPKQSETGFCHGLSSHIGIHADGTVVPCCLDKEARIDLGRMPEMSLSEILQGQRARAMKKGFEAKKLVEDLCQRCTYIKRFQPVKQAQAAI
ncbi:radical SAM/SPASM domain-containing protein [Bacteriovorax stolpii]|uniref:Radical SAM/SPASM domain-containing protein n=1 Tax=Bacteriovorax stolpii TaxID=960 RepID=A0A2K9NV42_BACTC|nr:radical SAM protein [Bacteriovorax stolpii]AUN99382.1 radical SAM/SPASM domain-containing protein [Bacteriovorax stolpii]QDK40638.1 radical SAM/SPASM domain-containing protein [Bacteriovorax stolpii]